MTKTVYILRGLPGSGKSTFASQLLSLVDEEGDFYVTIHSTDNYFVNDGGAYHFDRAKLGLFHQMNFENFAHSCESDIDLVICDNTNTTKAEYQKYVDVAKHNGYLVHLITFGNPKDPKHVAECAARNTHKVPLEAIQRMSDRFEL